MGELCYNTWGVSEVKANLASNLYDIGNPCTNQASFGKANLPYMDETWREMGVPNDYGYAPADSICINGNSWTSTNKDASLEEKSMEETIAKIVKESIKRLAEEEGALMKVIPEIEKYHIKHK